MEMKTTTTETTTAYEAAFAEVAKYVRDRHVGHPDDNGEGFVYKAGTLSLFQVDNEGAETEDIRYFPVSARTKKGALKEMAEGGFPLAEFADKSEWSEYDGKKCLVFTISVTPVYDDETDGGEKEAETFDAIDTARELLTTSNLTEAMAYAVKLGKLDPAAFTAVSVNLVKMYQLNGRPENRSEQMVKNMPFVFQAVKKGEQNLVRRLLAAMQATANKDTVKAMAMMYYEFTSLSWLSSEHKELTAKKIKGHHRLGDVWPDVEGDIETLAMGALATKKMWLTSDAIAAEANLAAGEKASFVESTGTLSKREVKRISDRIYTGIGIKATLTFQVWRMIVDGTTTVNNAKTTELATIKYKSVGDVKHDVERGVMLCALGRAVEYK